MTLLPDHADALFACVSSVLEGGALNLKQRDEVLSTMEAILRVARRAMAAHYGRWNTHTGSILPPELLSRCFEFLDFNDRLLASGISQHWRRVALSTPTLWSSFAVLLEAEEGMLKFDEMLRRSQAVPISITVYGTRHFDPLLHSDIPSAQLRSLDIYYMPEILDFPALEKLKVSTRARLGKAILGRSARSLRVLRLQDFVIQPMCPIFRNLREFEGSFNPDTDIAGFLALCPQLQSLAILCESSLGADPRPLFVALPQSIIDLSVFGIFYGRNPEFDPSGIWAGHRFRRLQISSLRDISSVLRLFESALSSSDPGWSMEILVNQTISYLLHTPAAETRITGPGYVYSLAVEAISNLQQSQCYLGRLTSLTVPLRYFGLCVETGIELPALTDLVLTVHPDRDYNPELPNAGVSTAMMVPRLQSFSFLCRPPSSFEKDAVHLALFIFPKRLRAWMRYDAERLQRMALVGEVPTRILDELHYRDPVVLSLVTTLHVGEMVWSL